MDSVVKVRECQWCHEPFYLSDGRYKYCSDECAEKQYRYEYKPPEWLVRILNDCKERLRQKRKKSK